MMQHRKFSWFILSAGVFLLAAGLLFLKIPTNPEGMMLALPYVCIGLGCGAFGNGLSSIINRKMLKDNPQLQKQLAIEQNDERNIALSNRAKAKAYDAMLYVFSGVIITFSLMRVSVYAVCLLVGAYLFVIGSFIFYLSKYHKKM